MQANDQSGIALFAAWIIGILQCGTLIFASLWIVTRAPVFDLYYNRLVHSPSPKDAHEIDAWLSSNNSKHALGEKVTQGRLSERELNHYADVRAWLRKVPIAFFGCASALIALWLVCRRAGLLILIEARALTFMLVLLCGCLGLAAWDWRIFFSWVHYPLFGATSWRFPHGSYSLQLFPSSFWRAAGMLVIIPPILIPILILAGSIWNHFREQKNRANGLD